MTQNLTQNTETQDIVIRIQDASGDRKINLSWVPEDKDAQSYMRDMMKDLQSKGYRFFTVKKVFGLFSKKGQEVKEYDATLGELIYVEPKNNKNTVEKELSKAKSEINADRGSLKMHELETTSKVRYEDEKKFNPEKDEIKKDKDIIATKKLRAG